MFKDITLGQYYQTDSLLHRLDPRIKLTGTLVFIISLFIANSFTGYLLAAVFLITMIRLSNVPFSYIIRGMRAILFILFITMAFNLFLTPGEVLVKFGIFKITREGVYFAARMAIRLIFLIIGSSLMTLTTTPTQLTDAMEALMNPLRRFHVPVHEIAMMMSIALRFIPILMEETDKIMKAQMVRFPQGQRPGHGHGGPLLPGRRGQDENEAAGLPETGQDRPADPAAVLRGHHRDQSRRTLVPGDLNPVI